IRRHQPGERGAILLAGDFGELLAERLKARIVHPRRQRDGHRLVRSERRCWRLSWCLSRWLGRRLRLGKDRHGRGHAPDGRRAPATRWVDERRGCRIAMSPRVASHAFSAGFSPLYGKKKGASAPVGLAPAAGLVEWGATKIAGAIMDDNLLSPPTSTGRTHQSESAQEKAAPGAGRMRAGTARVRH